MRKYLFLLLLPLYVGCAPESEQPVLTVTIAPLHYIVSGIAGDKYAINTLAPAGVSPETYEPTPRQMVDLGNSKALFRIGTLGFEQTRLNKLAMNTPNLAVFSVSDSIRLLPAADHGHGPDHGDQHIWTSPRNVKLMARNVCHALCRIDSAATPFYTERLARFEERVDSIDTLIRTQLDTVAHRAFLIYHPALGYFARDYGLQQFSVETDGKEPSAGHLQQLVNTCRSEGVRVVFIQKEYKGRSAQRIADEIGGKVIVINPLGADWEQEMVGIATALKKAEDE